jgi:hypothetical protein
MSDAGVAETRRAGAARLSAADARRVVLRGGHKEAAE